MIHARLLALALVVLLAGAIAGYFAWWRPNAHMRDAIWLESASEEQRVAESRKVLRLPFGQHHDACLCIQWYGGDESVPDLITGLRWLPDTGPGQSMSCEKRHCLEVLEKITGENVGDNHRDWKTWWLTTHG